MGVGGQRHTPATLSLGKTWYPLYRRLGGPQGQSGQVRKIVPPTGIQSLDRPTHSESLYRLSYPGPHTNHLGIQKGWRVNHRVEGSFWKNVSLRRCEDTVLSTARSYTPQKSLSLGSVKWLFHHSNVHDYLTEGGGNVLLQLLPLTNNKAIFEEI